MASIDASYSLFFSKRLFLYCVWANSGVGKGGGAGGSPITEEGGLYTVGPPKTCQDQYDTQFPTLTSPAERNSEKWAEGEGP